MAVEAVFSRVQSFFSNRELLQLCYSMNRGCYSINRGSKRLLRRLLREERIKELIRNGANPLYIPNPMGRCALEVLTDGSTNSDFIHECLCSQHVIAANLNASGSGIRIMNRIMNRIIINGYYEYKINCQRWAQILLRAGLDLNQLHNEMSPLLLAVTYGLFEIIDVLLQAKISPTHVDGIGRNALHLLTFAVEPTNLDTILQYLQKLIDYGVPLEGKDRDGNTPLLMFAKRKYNLEIPLLLLKNGADPSARNNKGKNFLDLHYYDASHLTYHSQQFVYHSQIAALEKIKPFVLHFYFYPECKRWVDVQLQRRDISHEDREVFSEIKNKCREHFTSNLVNVAISAILQGRVNYRRPGCIPEELCDKITIFFNQKVIAYTKLPEVSRQADRTVVAADTEKHFYP